jgi:hypothetical protein
MHTYYLTPAATDAIKQANGSVMLPCPVPATEMRNVLVLAEFRSRDRRFTGESLTGFGAL